MKPNLMFTALLAVEARHVSDSAPSIHNQSEHLRRRPNPQPRRVVPDSISEFHNLQFSTRAGKKLEKIDKRESQTRWRGDHRGASCARSAPISGVADRRRLAGGGERRRGT